MYRDKNKYISALTHVKKMIYRNTYRSFMPLWWSNHYDDESCYHESYFGGTMDETNPALYYSAIFILVILFFVLAFGIPILLFYLRIKYATKIATTQMQKAQAASSPTSSMFTASAL